MRNAGFTSAMICFAAGAGTMVLLYYAARLSLAWRAGHLAASRSSVRARLAAVPRDSHIAAEWTDGRRRLDALPALIEALASSLEREAAKLHRLDTDDPWYELAACNRVSPALRRFTSDLHLRDKCRVLSPFWSSTAGISPALRG